MEWIENYFGHVKLPLTNPVLIFSVLLFVILVSPIILKRFNVPGIIGLIISGIIIGPNGLNLIERSSGVILFSTIGLLYIMFIAGLELDMNDFRKNRAKSLVFGLYTFSIPMILGYVVFFYVLDYSLDASILTASMFASHTLLAYPIVSRLGVAKNSAVAITVGGTIFTDTLSLLVLAVIVSKTSGELGVQFWLKLTFSLAAFLVFMFFVIPRIAKWFFKTLESEKHSHYIFVLSVVFFAAFLAELSGVEAIIGAFIAGLSLNKLIPHSSALMNRIEFIGNSLFIPFFLISVGMVVNIRAFFTDWQTLYIAFIMTVLAIAAKWLAAFVTKLTFKFSKTEQNLVFGLSNAQAAATLAAVLVGYNAGLLDEKILNGTIVMILISCLVASIVTENAAKKLVTENETKSHPEEKFHNINEQILIPIARFSELSKILEFTIAIKNQNSTNPLSILTVVSNDEEAETNIKKAKKKLEEFVKVGSETETKIDVIVTIDQNEAGGILRISKEILADIIILGWPGKTNFLSRIFGEKLDNIINNSEKTLFITSFQGPFNVHKKIQLVAMPYCELETGFELWFSKVVKLSQQTSMPIHFYCSKKTASVFKKHVRDKQYSIQAFYTDFEDIEEYMQLSKYIGQEDLIVFVCARKINISYNSVIEDIPMKLEKNFPENSRLLIYP